MHNLPSVGPKIPFSRKTSRLRVRLTTWGRSNFIGTRFTMTRLIIVGLQLLGSSVTLAFWAAHQVTESAWAPSSLRHTPTRATFTLFVVYTAMAPIWMLCLFLDVYRKGTPASRLVVELAWVAALGAYHGYLIGPIIADGSTYRDGTFSVVYFAVQIAALILTFILCTAYIFTLCWIALENHISFRRPDVWVSGVRDFPWYGETPPAGLSVEESREPTNFLSTVILLCFGCSRGLGIYSGFYQPLIQFLSHHTIFRRVVDVEPFWLGMVRGTVGLAFLVGICAYGVVQCIKLPLEEDGNTLPTRPMQLSLWDTSPPFVSLENVTLAYTLYSTDRSWPSGRLPYQPNVEVFYPDGTSRQCNNSTLIIDDNPMWIWGCSRPQGIPAFTQQNAVNWLDSIQTYITVTMDWGALQNLKLNIPNLIALVGVDTVWENAASPKSYPSILYFQHPSFVRMRMGQHLRAEVGEYSILFRRLTFIDVFGISMFPNLRTYHPLVSLQPIDPTSVTTNPNISTVTFYPSFGLIGHHVLEQYRENTVLGGLGSTGGLYTILDLVFGFLFGKPLMAIMFNTKYISPFGFFITVFGKAAIQRKLSRKYPHLHSQEPAQQSVSTSAFLHDFVVDFGPKYDDCGDDEAGRGHDPSFEMRPRNITEESSEQSHLLRDDTRQSMRVEHASV